MIIRSARDRLKRLLVSLGVDRLLRPIYGGAGAILVLHRVRPRDETLRFEPNHRNSIAPDHFRDILEALAAARVDVVGIPALPERLAQPRPPRFVCLTFDDGYRDNHDIALPIAAEQGAPITVYVAPGLIDGVAPLWWYGLDQAVAREPRLRLPLDGEIELAARSAVEKEAVFARSMAYMIGAEPAGVIRVAQALAERYGVDFGALAAEHMMSWAMVRRMAASPLVEIGAHTMSHPNLARLDRRAALREMTDSRDRLAAEIGQPVTHLAYPFGGPEAAGRREVELAAEAGFSSAVIGVPGNLFAAHRHLPHAWPRHGIGPEDSLDALRLKLAGASRQLLQPWRRMVTMPQAAAG